MGRRIRSESYFPETGFLKAYDRVEFTYLWETFKAMGFGDDTIERIQGLAHNGSSVVHINQRFTEDIEVRRGVRQGCPLAPLLFALCTQPLMKMLRVEEVAGRIKGLGISRDRSLLHQLFADDTGICITAEERYFQTAKEVVNSTGKPKTNLIAWWKFGIKKDEGGLNWVPLKDKGTALQIRNVAQILEDKDIEWVQMAKNMI
ncbi:hypothetical protein R1sor_020789 [Riccia sorocarpa]|uniref:Reverse transcriptase domain-containing protein n=1 Tax=Riccia sorocarpa TaxID=122646 RepID=A0ABD3GF68_9MARC